MGKRRVERTRNSGEWTEARYWGFIRSHLRLMSNRWNPIRKTCFERVRRPNQSDNKRMKWEYQCERCKQWFRRDEVEADHRDPCGSLKSYEDIGPFVERLLCEADGIDVLCRSCHAQKTKEKK